MFKIGDNSIVGTIGICCCLLIVVLFVFGFLGGDNSSSSTDIVVNSSLPEDIYGNYESPPGEWNVVDGILSNGTYNSTDLTKKWDINTSTTLHVKSPKFTFVYSNGNSSKYNGDSGLEYSMFNDSLGCCYHIGKDLTRGIAYATQGKFNIDGFYFSRVRGSGNDYYEVYSTVKENITLDNGTVIKPLKISDDLTAEQKMYFDDYEDQLYRYYEDKKIKELEDTQDYIGELEDEMSYQSSKSSSSKSGSFSGYSSRGGYIYGRYN